VTEKDIEKVGKDFESWIFNIHFFLQNLAQDNASTKDNIQKLIDTNIKIRNEVIFNYVEYQKVFTSIEKNLLLIKKRLQAIKIMGKSICKAETIEEELLNA
jgi:hypothetical protein